MPAPSDSWSNDEHLARAILPRIEDLTGEHWQLDAPAEDDDDPEADRDASDANGPDLAGLVSDAFPAEFPDGHQRAAAEVSYIRAGHALVIGLATVFEHPTEATEAWTVLMSVEFARLFAESVAEEVQASGPIELLGPVVAPSAFTVERGGVCTARHRAVFSGAASGSVTPVVLHFAVTRCGRAVVLVWAVDEGGRADDDAWDRLVTQVESRAECARDLDV